METVGAKEEEELKWMEKGDMLRWRSSLQLCEQGLQ